MINISRKLKWANNNEKEEKVNYFHKVFTRKTIKPHCKSTLFITCLFPLVLSCYSQVWLFAIPWALQAPLSTEFSWQECWSGFPCPPSGDLPDSGIESMSSATPWTVAHQAPSNHGISQARLPEWVAIYYSRGSSLTRDQTYTSCIGKINSLSPSHQGSPVLVLVPPQC